MKYAERQKLIERLPYESRLAFVGFCVERCLNEARRHPAAAAQLANLPLLEDGLAILWARAEGGTAPDAERVEAIRAQLSAFEQPDDDMENLKYNYDVTLVDGALELRNGLRLALDPETAEADVVTSALNGPVQTVGGVYADWQDARRAELEVIDTALQRLKKLGKRPFSRDAFNDIPDWTRGKLSPKYAEGRLTGTDVNKDE
jgi:hypothetical protein